VVSLQQRKFNERVTEQLRSRRSANPCTPSRPCAECGCFYQPDAQTTEGLCEWCVQSLASA
jgi:hypothetical protein